MSDGLLVDMDGDLEEYRVCLSRLDEMGQPKSKFEVWDIGVPRSDDDEFLRALELKPSKRDDGTYCFKVKNPKQKQTYFLIARVDDPASEDGSLYGSEAAAWWTFAALYTVLAILTALTFLAHFAGYPLHYYFSGLFLFLTVMCTVRAIYFYSLAAGVFDSTSVSAGAYFLIEFPTLLYFTAFSCLGAFWIFLLYAHSRSQHSRTVLGVTILFNILLYLLFTVLIILFQTLDSSSANSICPGRIAEEEDNTNQQIVSLVYQGFMAGVSLFIALVVAVYGGKLFLGLKKRNFENKIAMVTIECSAGLLVHCGFILYLSATLEYDFVVIVVMIILSELIPIFLITFQFSLLRVGNNKMPSYNKKSSFLRTMGRLLRRPLSSGGSMGPSFGPTGSTLSRASVAPTTPSASSGPIAASHSSGTPSDSRTSHSTAP